MASTLRPQENKSAFGSKVLGFRTGDSWKYWSKLSTDLTIPQFPCLLNAKTQNLPPTSSSNENTPKEKTQRSAEHTPGFAKSEWGRCQMTPGRFRCWRMPEFQTSTTICSSPYSSFLLSLSTRTQRGQNRPLEGKNGKKDKCGGYSFQINIHFYELEVSGSLPTIRGGSSSGSCRSICLSLHIIILLLLLSFLPNCEPMSRIIFIYSDFFGCLNILLQYSL